MDRLDELARGLQRLPQALELATEQVVRDNTAFLEDANTEQLSQGKDSTGKDITPEYADLTRTLKEIKGQPTDRVTLRDKGDFYTSIVANLGGKQFEMVATDPKSDELQEKYGEEILGLTEDTLEEFRQDYVKPELLEKTRSILGV
ncbi:hypothetical protein SAMN06265337_0638 [Hymenobacter gelipurpurascens]|uniref:Uncharacterized protein n=1 Tax=Hymenobacter gelipurpurascens TaxID=89968 RepID=A0A212T8Y6_9BACT|nr:hypothetical protein [Hymenobacter gelipurpurascens]SNC62276.1 hypothetical protein SAMN06265337_0638 [Hymenobacter gelipurpurascens]